MKSFAAQVSEWAHKVEGAVEVVFRESAQEVVSEAQRPGPSVASTRADIKAGLGTIGRGKKKRAIAGPVPAAGQGGRLPVDTGFLRASLRASTTAPPPIDSQFVPADGKKYAFDESSIEAVIAGAEIGQTLYFGYTAAYARAMEYGSGGGPAYAFVRTVAQKWPSIVDAKAAELKGRLGL
ncbi:HK97 gp10 family phage protein [Aureimonas phyllosphaerae]|uniref:HK97 gp10 family phage protein n=1 Tax=Aureimonas phyllosphaerae TaxID=1166078 RepID=UPI003A5BF48F